MADPKICIYTCLTIVCLFLLLQTSGSSNVVSKVPSAEKPRLSTVNSFRLAVWLHIFYSFARFS